MRRRAALHPWLAAAIVFALSGSGCTIRYSQTLVGEIERIEGRPLKTSESGFELGAGFNTAGLTFVEPTESYQLLDVPCDLALSQVDYRGTWFSLYYVTLNFPKVETAAYCVR
ncbi:MAG: hypothetical protein JSU66_13335 [Deltaproteobacteria bacterium]|nr:MAG: hypothetical protein JSU66_13335 [Deltaproteobacteria bacterium]